jgi:hypothetical protein
VREAAHLVVQAMQGATGRLLWNETGTRLVVDRVKLRQRAFLTIIHG